MQCRLLYHVYRSHAPSIVHTSILHVGYHETVNLNLHYRSSTKKKEIWKNICLFMKAESTQSLHSPSQQYDMRHLDTGHHSKCQTQLGEHDGDVSWCGGDIQWDKEKASVSRVKWTGKLALVEKVSWHPKDVDRTPSLRKVYTIAIFPIRCFCPLKERWLIHWTWWRC